MKMCKLFETVLENLIGPFNADLTVEVKSSRKYDHASLDKFLRKYKQFLGPVYVLHSKDRQIKDSITYLPLYMAPLVAG